LCPIDCKLLQRSMERFYSRGRSFTDMVASMLSIVSCLYFMILTMTMPVSERNRAWDPFREKHGRDSTAHPRTTFHHPRMHFANLTDRFRQSRGSIGRAPVLRAEEPALFSRTSGVDTERRRDILLWCWMMAMVEVDMWVMWVTIDGTVFFSSL
jgi:hypothetical protein